MELQDMQLQIAFSGVFMTFSYHLPVNLIFGRGRAAEAGEITSGFGKKALLVTGCGSARATGLTQRIAGLLDKAGVECELFDEVEPNPLISTVERGAERIRSADCDVVVGVGGGSAMDAAKAIAFMALNPGDISDYIYGKRTGSRALPIVLIPTTAGTGSEGNGFAVLTHDKTRDKKGLKVASIVPSASIVDSELMQTMPPRVIASTGYDAFVHCLEAAIARRANPMSTMLALDGIRLLSSSLLTVYAGEGSAEDWDSVALAATYGGMAIGTAGSGVAHALEHPVSGLHGVTHGEGLAAILPEILERTWPYAVQPLSQVSVAMGERIASAGQAVKKMASIVRAMQWNLKLNRTLGELGVEYSDLEWLADNALKTMAASIENNPLVFDRKGIIDIYEACL